MGLGLDVLRIDNQGLEVLAKELPKYEIADFEELKAEIIKQTAPYKGLVISETDVSAAKTIRANLNKFSDALDGKRKEVKQELMDSMLPLEVQIKELVGLVVDAKMNIDNQVKAFEEAEKLEKKNRIKVYYNQLLETIDEVVDNEFDLLFDQKWLNRSTSDSEWKGQLEGGMLKLGDDLNNLIMIANGDQRVALIFRQERNFQTSLNRYQQLKKLDEVATTEKTPTVAPITHEYNEPVATSTHEYHRITVEFTFEPKQMAEFKEMVNYIENTSIAYKIIGKDKI